MHSPQEMARWSNEEVLAEVKRLLPEGHIITCGFDKESEFWFATVRDATNKVVWEDFRADLKFALLNAYGWRVLSQRTPQEHSPWVRRRDLTNATVARKAAGIEDPADLDPDEVASVYKNSQ